MEGWLWRWFYGRMERHVRVVGHVEGYQLGRWSPGGMEGDWPCGGVSVGEAIPRRDGELMGGWGGRHSMGMAL